MECVAAWGSHGNFSGSTGPLCSVLFIRVTTGDQNALGKGFLLPLHTHYERLWEYIENSCVSLKLA